MSRHRAGAGPRALLLTIVGAFARDAGGWMAVSHMVDLMGVLDVDEPSVRSAISRMKRSGLLCPERAAGVAGYRLTEEAMEILEDGDERIYGSAIAADPAEGWVIAAFHVPEAERSKRHQLRARLSWIGFGRIDAGLWVAPVQTLPQARRMLARTGLARFTTLFVGHPVEPASTGELIRQAWDLAHLAKLYEDFLSAHMRARDGNCAFPAPTGDQRSEAFAAYVRLVTDWRRLPFMDPGLPSEYLPEDWPGARARELFAQGERVLELPAAGYVAEVTGQSYVPEAVARPAD